MGNSSSRRVTDRDRAILDMKIQRDKLKQYQTQIQIVLARENDIAKRCLAQGDRRRALLALRQRKYQESLLGKTDEQLESLQQLFALVQKDVVYGLRQGNKVLKQIHDEISLENVEKIMDDTADAIAYQAEISNLLSQRISNAEEIEVLEELEKLLQEQATSLDESPAIYNLPDAPAHTIPATVDRITPLVTGPESLVPA